MTKTIGLITYQANHLKTEQILLGLIHSSKSYEIKVFALPFVERKKREPIFNHRPNQNLGANVKDLCDYFKIEYLKCESDLEIENNCSIYLICGSGLLSSECLEGKNILNVHPGIIPITRGLDSFKWALVKKNPIGNTLHFIDERADLGVVKYIKQTPLFPSDTIYSFARRHYDLEIDLMVNWDYYLDKDYPQEFAQYEIQQAEMRMPKSIEFNIFEAFEDYKLAFNYK